MKKVTFVGHCVALLFVASAVLADFSDGEFDRALLPSKEVTKCLVCKAVVDEVEMEVEKVDPNKKIDVGSFRLDGNGNIKQNMVPYARSEMHLSEVVDKVCSGPLKDYVVASYKATGQPTLLRLTTPDGNMNPEMSNVDLVSNPEVNEKLAYYCNQLIEDYEDDIVAMFGKADKDPHHKLCVALSGFCPKSAIADEDDSDDFDREEL